MLAELPDADCKAERVRSESIFGCFMNKTGV